MPGKDTAEDAAGGFEHAHTQVVGALPVSNACAERHGRLQALLVEHLPGADECLNSSRPPRSL